MNIKKIEELRKQHNLSQNEFAKRIGISQVGYNNAIKRGDFKVSLIEKIAETFGVSVSYFFPEDNIPTSPTSIPSEIDQLIIYFDEMSINSIKEKLKHLSKQLRIKK